MQGQTVIETVIDHLLEVNDLEIIVILGHEAEQVRTVLASRKIKMVVNKNHLKGMTTSIQCGVAAAAADSLGYLICLADLPLISATTYQRICEAFRQIVSENASSILIPTYQSQKGHPVVFASQFKAAILHHPFMEGCKKIIQDHPQSLQFFPTDDSAILLDMDTPDDYQNLRKGK